MARLCKDGVTYYAQRTVVLPNGKKTTLSLHRFIMGLEHGDPMTVDHINGDPLDNRDCNLRLATRTQQTYTQRRRGNTKYGYKGVVYLKRDNKWEARIKINKVPTYLGQFDNPEEAHEAYIAKAREIHGEFFREDEGIIIQKNLFNSDMFAPGRWKRLPTVTLRCVWCDNLFSWRVDGWQLSKLGPPSTCCKSCQNKAWWRSQGVRWDSKTWGVWYGMMRRCYNSEREDFKRYGQRGIKVCERWNKVENFVEDMGLKPDGLWLERINNDGNYEPSNCCWATPKEQAGNRRTSLVNRVENIGCKRPAA
jgi:hypothetical protein